MHSCYVVSTHGQHGCKSHQGGWGATVLLAEVLVAVVTLLLICLWCSLVVLADEHFAPFANVGLGYSVLFTEGMCKLGAA